jgi:hypothetical protein
MRTALAALGIMLLAACGQPTPQASRSAPTSNTAGVSASPSPNEASATPLLTSPSAAAQSPSPTPAASPTLTPQAPKPRALAAVTYDSDRSELVIFGGQGPPTATSAFEYLGDTWTWSSAGWKQKSVTGPSPRFAATMAYDSSHHVAVLFSGDASGETWTWDGKSWTQQHPATSPPPRQDASMVYDAGHQVVVLFGGQTTQQLNDTWVWDGVNWKQLHPATSPSPRVFASMAYDSAHAKVVLFGGSSGQGQVYDGGYADTWVWDGANWTKVSSTTNPAPRSEASMAYDSAHGQVVLFGGVSGTGSQYGVLSDTWSWDGTNWTGQRPSTPPSARLGSAMDFDAATNEVVLFGGMAFQPPNQMLADTWLWNGDAWTEQS